MDDNGNNRLFNIYIWDTWESMNQVFNIDNDIDDEIDKDTKDDDDYDDGSLENIYPDDYPQIIQEIRKEIIDNPNLSLDPSILMIL
jgi:hypothetical protein